METIYYAFLTNTTPRRLNEILGLYRMAGWWPDANDDIETIAGIVAGSHCFMAAVKEDTIIGMGRAISDRVSDAYIQDVTVHADYRGRGIGKKIIKQLIERLHDDGLSWIGLIAERNSHGFYAQIGFQKMLDSVPMVMISK